MTHAFRRAQLRYDAQEPPDLDLRAWQEDELDELAPRLAEDFDSFSAFAQACAEEIGTRLDLSDNPTLLDAWSVAHPDPDEE